MTAGEQHDDHIWLTAGGSAWAIMRIHGNTIYLWRGYAPKLEYAVIRWHKKNWPGYADVAAQLLKAGEKYDRR